VEVSIALSYPYPLVVFDLDGTLVDSAADIAEALNRTLEDWQLPRVPEATVLTWIGDGVRRWSRHSMRLAAPSNWTR